MRDIIKILEKDGRATPEQIAKTLNRDVDEVKSIIKKLEDEKIIASYKAVINWEKVDSDLVVAIIEVKITPQIGKGFDRVASRIYQFPEVKSVYLMSGSYDLSINIEGKTVREIARFVSEKLAPIECVISTATHFVLKKYKDGGVILTDGMKDDREVITL